MSRVFKNCTRNFQDRLSHETRDINWSPKLYDLTSFNFFLCGSMKEQVYVNNPQTVPALKKSIEAVVSLIMLQLCEKVMQNFLYD